VMSIRSSTASRSRRDVLTSVRHLPQPGDLSSNTIQERACPVCGARSGQPCISDKAASGMQLGAITHAGRFVVAP